MNTNFSRLEPPLSLDELLAHPQFARYFDLLTEWNQRFNLTAITDRGDVYIKHFLDSILPAALFPHGASVLDVGSGAGFPGICLKLVRPDLTVTLLDSVGKKVTFLTAAIEDLGLSGITAVKSRIEDFRPRSFDVVTARAVAACNILAEYCLPFAKVGGFALFYKSGSSEEELAAAARAIEVLGGGIAKVEKVALDDVTERSFVVIKKVRNTPPMYPRGGNKPRLQPL